MRNITWPTWQVKYLRSQESNNTHVYAQKTQVRTIVRFLCCLLAHLLRLCRWHLSGLRPHRFGILEIGITVHSATVMHAYGQPDTFINALHVLQTTTIHVYFLRSFILCKHEWAIIQSILLAVVCNAYRDFMSWTICYESKNYLPYFCCYSNDGILTQRGCILADWTPGATSQWR